MGEEISNRDSISDSSFSRSSADALIAKSPQEKGSDLGKRTKRNSKRIACNFLEIGSEARKDSFRWIPNPREMPSRERRHSPAGGLDSVHRPLDGAASPSSCASDFASQNRRKSGYIRGCDKSADSLLKYNEFGNLVTTLGGIAGSEYPIEVKFGEREMKKSDEGGSLRISGENAGYVIAGGAQLMLGILMAAFGVLVIAYGSSMSSVGSGMWGGAVAMFSGLLGVLAGLKGCYSTTKSQGAEGKTSPTLLTGFLALCLISFSLSNLVLVLTATGLIRDLQTPVVDQEKNSITLDGETSVNWPPVLADAGLMLVAALQCIVTVISGYKCYRKVCPCLRRDHKKLSETDSNGQKYKAAGKDRLVNQWLGQQFPVPEKCKKNEKQEAYSMPWGTPNIVFLPPPPPIITSGQVPIWTFLQAPSSVFGSSACSHVYGSSMPCCCHRDNRYLLPQHQPLMLDHKPPQRRVASIDPDPKMPIRSRPKKSVAKERRASLPTAEEVAKTYTGLDREIAEEFIAIAMDRGRRRSRNNSLGDPREYTITPVRDGF